MNGQDSMKMEMLVECRSFQSLAILLVSGLLMKTSHLIKESMIGGCVIVFINHEELIFGDLVLHTFPFLFCTQHSNEWCFTFIFGYGKG
jgi:hypothetical protein